MEISLDLQNSIHFVSVVLGVLSGLVILYFAVRKNPKNIPLGIGQICLSIAIWQSISVLTGILVHIPFMYRVGNAFAWIFIPLPFLYLVFHTKNRLWQWWDFLHFLPALIYILDFGPIFLLTSEVKQWLILMEINDPNLYARFNQSRWFPPGFHQPARTVAVSLYWFAQMFYFFQWTRAMKSPNHQEKIWKNWMIFFLVCQFLLVVPFFLTFLWVDRSLTFSLVHSGAAIWLSISSFLLFFYPSLLYGNIGVQSRVTTKRISKPDLKEEERLRPLMYQIQNRMQEERLYLRPSFSISDFSKEIGIPVYQISLCLNHFESLSYVDFVNRERVKYCAERIYKKDWQNFTLEAIAEECGFSNRNSFTKAFKKHLGFTPSDFREGKAFYEG